MGNRKETFEFVYLKNCIRGSACDRVLISLILLEREENVDFFVDLHNYSDSKPLPPSFIYRTSKEKERLRRK